MVKRLVSPTKTVIEQMLAPADRRFVDPDIEIEEDLQGSGEFATKKSYHFSTSNRAYIREIMDNINRIADLLETYKDVSVSLETQYSQQQEMKMNKTMYTLTIVSTVSILKFFY